MTMRDLASNTRLRTGRAPWPAPLLLLCLLFAGTSGSPAAAAAPVPPAAGTRAPVRKVKPPVKPQPVAPAAPAPAEPDPWSAARGLADRGRPDSALALLRTAIARTTDNFALRWLEAGIAGETGRHGDAVARYERLAADHPARAGELGSDLAAERLAAGDSRGAVRDYRHWLAAHPTDHEARAALAMSLAQSDSSRQALAMYDALMREQPANTDLALERARVLGWMDRHAQAIAAYSAILAREPEHKAAMLGLAVNENWSGRHRHAARRLETLLAGRGADPEARKVLAFARYWDDDPEAAARALDVYRAQVPDDAEARRLADRIARERQSSVEVGFGRADDSDGLHVSSPSIEVRWPLAARTTGTAGWRNDLVRDGVANTSVIRMSAGVRHRLNPAWTFYATGAHDLWDDGLGTRWGGELGAISRPFDRVRFEALTARDPVMTRVSLQNGISLLQWAGTADVTPVERLDLHADARAGFYSDGNQSERTGASASYTVVTNRTTDLAVQLGVEQLNVHQDLDNGYYDPDFHREWGPGAELAWHPNDRWSAGGTTQLGWQRDKGADNERFYSVTGRVVYVPDPDWTLSLTGGRGDSNLQSAGGYRRAWWQCSVQRGF